MLFLIFLVVTLAVLLITESNFKQIGDIPTTPGGIPKIIYKTSWQKKDEMPKEIINVLEITKQLNPGYQLKYFDDTDVLQFMKEYSDEAFVAYNKLIPGAYKADLFRYCILEKYGGCYSDIGHIMKVSFDDICEDCNLVLVKDWNGPLYAGIHNAFICTPPGTVFMKELVKKCISNISNEYYGENALDPTGPTMMGKVYNCVLESDCSFQIKELIKVGIKDKTKIFLLNVGSITDVDGRIIMNTKFDNYYDIMYPNGKSSAYGDLWTKRKIYKS
jgi:hypothetical protein